MMVKRQTRRRLPQAMNRLTEGPGESPSWTLPLFESGPHASVPPRPSQHLDAAPPKDLALHIYWSMCVDGHALAHSALRAEYPDERRALLELRAGADALKESARRLLADVWQVKIGATAPARPGAIESAPRAVAS